MKEKINLQTVTKLVIKTPIVTDIFIVKLQFDNLRKNQG